MPFKEANILIEIQSTQKKSVKINFQIKSQAFKALS